MIRASARQIDPGALFSYLAIYQDLGWVLDDEQQRQVLAMPPSAFDNDRANWGIVRTQLYHLRGDRARAAIYADSARIAFEEQSRAAPDDAAAPRACSDWPWPIWGGRRTRCGKASERWSCSRSAGTPSHGPYIQLQLVRIYLLVGEPEKALDQLEPLLKIPYYLSPGWLRIDPTFDPLRSNPRFRKLVEGTA